MAASGMKSYLCVPLKARGKSIGTITFAGAESGHRYTADTLRALKQKVHVLCERPLSLTAGGINRILDTAKSVDCKVVVGNNHRFRSDVQQLSRFLQGGELGNVIGMRAGQYQFRSGQQGWRQRKAEACGGEVLEYGYPLLDHALWLGDFP